MEVASALGGSGAQVTTVIAGLGGRAITRRSLKETFLAAIDGRLPALYFMDLNKALVDRQLEREKKSWRVGPANEEMVRDAARQAGK